MKKTNGSGVIRMDEAYSKKELLARLGVSQRFWDQMLDEGLPFSPVGHTRWVTGHDVIEYLRRHLTTKTTSALSAETAGSFPRVCDGQE